MNPIVVNGYLVYVTYNPDGLVTQVVVPEYTDPNTGQPLTLSITPAQALAYYQAILMGILPQGGPYVLVEGISGSVVLDGGVTSTTKRRKSAKKKLAKRKR